MHLHSPERKECLAGLPLSCPRPKTETWRINNDGCFQSSRARYPGTYVPTRYRYGTVLRQLEAYGTTGGLRSGHSPTSTLTTRGEFLAKAHQVSEASSPPANRSSTRHFCCCFSPVAIRRNPSLLLYSLTNVPGTLVTQTAPVVARAELGVTNAPSTPLLPLHLLSPCMDTVNSRLFLLGSAFRPLGTRFGQGACRGTYAPTPSFLSSTCTSEPWGFEKSPPATRFATVRGILGRLD